MYWRSCSHHTLCSVGPCGSVVRLPGFHLEQKVGGGGGGGGVFWKEELSNARGIWAHAPPETFEPVPGCGAWSLVVSMTKYYMMYKLLMSND